MGKHGGAYRIALSSQNDRATTTINTYRKFHEVSTCGLCERTDRHTDAVIAILHNSNAVTTKATLARRTSPKQDKTVCHSKMTYLYFSCYVVKILISVKCKKTAFAIFQTYREFILKKIKREI